MVKELIKKGHEVTVATRGKRKDNFKESVERIIVDHTNLKNMHKVFKGKEYDVVYDDIAYCSNDVKRSLESINCKKYIMVSSTAVYNKHIDTKEEEFNPINKEVIWGNRDDFSYEEGKRQAEYALVNKYKNQNSLVVRFPFVIGKDDYTERLLFYVEHIIKEIPMYIDNINDQLGYISSDDAGRFLAFLDDKECIGAINGASLGTISLKEIISYVEDKSGKKALISLKGEEAPYNKEKQYSINTNRAKAVGFQFTNLKDWIYPLLDYYINKMNV